MFCSSAVLSDALLTVMTLGKRSKYGPHEALLFFGHIQDHFLFNWFGSNQALSKLSGVVGDTGIVRHAN